MNNPTKIHYIGVYLLSAAIAFLAAVLLQPLVLLFVGFVTNENPFFHLDFYNTYLRALQLIFQYFCFVFIFGFFKSLNYLKVIPYIWILSFTVWLTAFLQGQHLEILIVFGMMHTLYCILLTSKFEQMYYDKQLSSVEA